MVMTTSAGGIKGSRTLRKIAKNSAPLGNIKAEDVGNASLYYFSDLSKKVTANIHYVDGGINKMGILTMNFDPSILASLPFKTCIGNDVVCISNFEKSLPPFL